MMMIIFRRSEGARYARVPKFWPLPTVASNHQAQALIALVRHRKVMGRKPCSIVEVNGTKQYVSSGTMEAFSSIRVGISRLPNFSSPEFGKDIFEPEPGISVVVAWNV